MKDGKLACGMKNGMIAIVDAKADAKPNPVMLKHCEGEVWGLVSILMPDNSIRIITSCDDNRIIAYNATARQHLAEGIVDVPKKGKKKDKKEKKGGASSMSNQPHECQSRALAYNKANGHLAVANNMGLVTIRELDWGAVDAGKEGCMMDVKNKLFAKDTAPNRWIEIMQYSPCGNYLCIGDHKMTLHVFKVGKDGKYKAVKTTKTGHSSALNGIDWSLDSKWIRSVDQGCELLFWSVGKECKREPGGASATKDVDWASQTCKFGWYVQGIIPEGAGASDVNSVGMNQNNSLIITGDDNGALNVYRSPCVEGGKPNIYRGHSEHITTVTFSEDMQKIFSTGGQDQCTF